MIYRELAVQLGLRALALSLGVVTIAIVPIAISADEYGRFALALSACQFAAGVLVSWPNLGTLRYSREEFAKHGRIGETFAARLTLHGGLLAFALFGTLALGPHAARLLDLSPHVFTWLAAAAIVVLPLGELGTVAAQTVGRFVAYGLAQVLVRGTQFAAVAAMAMGSLSPQWTTLVMATIAGWTLAGIISWRSSAAAVCRDFSIRKETVKKLVSYGWLMGLATFAAYSVASMDLWFIKAFLGTSQVGIYAWAYVISYLATSILVPIAGLLAPRAIDARLAVDGARLATMARAFLAVTSLAIAIMPIPVAAFGAIAGGFDLGGYTAAVAPALIILAGTTFQLSMALMEPVIFAHERLVWRGVTVMFTLAGVNALLNYLLIPRVGIVGAAVATVAAFASGTLLQWGFARRQLAISHILPPPIYLVTFGLIPVAAALAWPTLSTEAALPVLLLLAVGLGLWARRQGWFRGFADMRPAAMPLPAHMRTRVASLLLFLAGPAIPADEPA